MKVVVVGAGVVGRCTALALRREGADVTVLDKATRDHGASIANAGWLTPVLSAPMSGPGVVPDVVKATLRGDRYVGGRPVAGLVGWTARFLRSCRAASHLDGLRVTFEFAARAVEQFRELKDSGVEFEMHERGLILAACTEHGLGHAVGMVNAAREAGYEHETQVLDAASARRLEPALGDGVVGAVYAPAEAHVRPESVQAGLRAALLAEGVELREGVDVHGVERDAPGWRVATGAGPVAADRVVIAAGAASAPLLRGLGVRVPLLSGKGYSITAKGTGTTPTHPVKLLEATLASTPFDDGLRMSGKFELGARTEKVHEGAIRLIRKGAARYFRDWQPVEPQLRLAGLRPSTPDSLPIIGPVPGSDGMFVATGHGTLGLTLAPATAAALAPLVLHDKSAPELARFTVERFGTR